MVHQERVFLPNGRDETRICWTAQKWMLLLLLVMRVCVVGYNKGSGRERVASSVVVLKLVIA